jgi:hypothetical protein
VSPFLLLLEVAGKAYQLGSPATRAAEIRILTDSICCDDQRTPNLSVLVPVAQGTAAMSVGRSVVRLVFAA